MVTSCVPEPTLTSAIIAAMILLTGGTGFIGSHLIEKLVSVNIFPRLLLRPKKETPQLIPGKSFDITVSSLGDLGGLRSAMRNVEIIIHLASSEQNWPDVDLEETDTGGLQNLLIAAKEAGVNKILFLSRIGMDKNSSYPVLRTKAICEAMIKSSGLAFTIIRLGDVYGQGDHFTRLIASSLRFAPGFLPLPDNGKTVLQPLWVEDLLSIITLLLEIDDFDGKTLEIGGGEYLEFATICKIIMEIIHRKKVLLPVPSAYLRILNLWFRPFKGSFPLPTIWLDLLAMDRICPLDSMSRNFNILPVRFATHLNHLRETSKAKKPYGGS